MQEFDLMFSELLFSKSKVDKESRPGSYHLMKNDDLVNEWFESADNENTLTAPKKTIQTISSPNQEHQTKASQIPEPSSDPAQAADRDSQLPPLIQQFSFEINKTGIGNVKASVLFLISNELRESPHAGELVDRPHDSGRTPNVEYPNNLNTNLNNLTDPLINTSTHVWNTYAEQAASYYFISLAYSQNFFVAPADNVVDSSAVIVPSTAGLLNTSPVLNLTIPNYTPHPGQNAAQSVNN